MKLWVNPNNNLWFFFFKFWILPSMVGGSALYFLSVDKWHRVAALLYGSGLTGLFLTSTLFHTAAWKISHLRWVLAPVCISAVLVDFQVAVGLSCYSGRTIVERRTRLVWNFSRRLLTNGEHVQICQKQWLSGGFMCFLVLKRNILDIIS